MVADLHKKILFVPGKNPKPLPAEHHALLWRCLLRAVQLAQPGLEREMMAHGEVLQLVAWNGIYYQHIKAVEEDIPWVDLMLAKSGPDPLDQREALTWRRRRAWLMYTLVDIFPFLLALVPDPAVKNTITETERYFSNHEDIGRQVRELLKAPLRKMFTAGDRVMVIGHSMGTVIAYDTLWEMSHQEHNPGRIDSFLTLGSPLGMRYVQDRLVGFHNGQSRRYPHNIRRWHNVAAEGDLTALDPRLRNDFLPMVERGLVEEIIDEHEGVFTYFRNQDGLNVHRSYGYLAHPSVGRIIADWWLDRSPTTGT